MSNGAEDGLGDAVQSQLDKFVHEMKTMMNVMMGQVGFVQGLYTFELVILAS